MHTCRPLLPNLRLRPECRQKAPAQLVPGLGLRPPCGVTGRPSYEPHGPHQNPLTGIARLTCCLKILHYELCAQLFLVPMIACLRAVYYLFALSVVLFPFLFSCFLVGVHSSSCDLSTDSLLFVLVFSFTYSFFLPPVSRFCRSQVAASNPGVFDYTGSADAFRKIVKREGVKVHYQEKAFISWHFLYWCITCTAEVIFYS